MTRYHRHVLPSGMVVTTMMPEFEPMTYGTYCMPTKPIPWNDPEEIAANDRREAARKALAVLRDATPPEPVPTLAGQPCATCTFRRVPRIPPPVFPLPPFEPYEPAGERLPYRIEFYGVNYTPRFYVPSII